MVKVTSYGLWRLTWLRFDLFRHHDRFLNRAERPFRTEEAGRLMGRIPDRTPGWLLSSLVHWLVICPTARLVGVPSRQLVGFLTV